MSKAIFAAVVFLGVAMLLPRAARAAGAPERLQVYVDCHCPDAIGQKFFATLKDKISASAEYRLASGTSGYGIGVHLSSIDFFQGIDDKLAGHIAAVSVAFTIFSDRLPGEVYSDASVFRVGQDASEEAADRILDAVGQIAKLNQTVLSKMAPTAAPAKPTPAAKPSASPPQ
jgi:hypothetical protein